MKARFLIILMLIPILLPGNTWLERLFNSAGNSLPQAVNRSWRLQNKTVSSPSGSAWEDSERYVYHYNPAHASQIDSLSLLGYDVQAGEWTDAGYIHNTWLPGGEYLETSIMGLRFMSMSFEYMKTYAVYDNQQRLIHFYMYSQPFPIRSWEPMQRIHIVYTGNEYTAYTWEEAEENRPSRYGKISFTWDNQGRVLTETEMSSADSLNWSNDSRTTYTWHPNDTTTGAQYIQHIAHIMPQMLMMMDDDFNPGMISQLLREDWSGSWVTADKKVYSFNTDNSLAEVTSYYYNAGVWTADSKTTNSYDANHNLSLEEEFYWDDGFNSWIPDQRISYIWEQSSAAVDEEIPAADLLSLAVYPVPFSSQLSIRPDGKSLAPVTIEVYNLKGQLVHKAVTPPNSVYSWNEATPDGMYLIKATQDGRGSIRKALRIK